MTLDRPRETFIGLCRMKKARGLGNGHPCEHYDGWETTHRNSSYTETNRLSSKS